VSRTMVRSVLTIFCLLYLEGCRVDFLRIFAQLKAGISPKGAGSEMSTVSSC